MFNKKKRGGIHAPSLYIESKYINRKTFKQKNIGNGVSRHRKKIIRNKSQTDPIEVIISDPIPSEVKS